MTRSLGSDARRSHNHAEGIMIQCACCERRLGVSADRCSCDVGRCLTCFLCENHCRCALDVREIVYDEDARSEPAALVLTRRES